MHNRFSAFILSAWNGHFTKIFILPTVLSLYGQQYVWTFKSHFHTLAINLEIHSDLVCDDYTLSNINGYVYWWVQSNMFGFILCSVFCIAVFLWCICMIHGICMLRPFSSPFKPIVGYVCEEKSYVAVNCPVTNSPACFFTTM
jgi:hypothetical protein